MAVIALLGELWVFFNGHSHQSRAGGVSATHTATPPQQSPADPFPAVPAGDFNAPIASYRAYAVRQLAAMEIDVSRLEHGLISADRSEAEAAWRGAFSAYQRLGAVYVGGRTAAFDQAIDGTPAGLAAAAASPKFRGLHRLEFGLWNGQSLPSLRPWARMLAEDVAALRRALPSLEITPSSYVTRAHEILEDAARDLLSGVAVPWSGEGVLGTDAALAATTEVVNTLVPLLDSSQGPLDAVHTALRGMRSTMASLRAGHGGALPTNSQLSQLERERLDASIGQALDALSQIPEALDVDGEASAQTPPIPATAFRTAR